VEGKSRPDRPTLKDQAPATGTTATVTTTTTVTTTAKP
jgi:hypothetical protein